jgi:hypothetical protein
MTALAGKIIPVESRAADVGRFASQSASFTRRILTAQKMTA